jgi:CBS domain-containing protein
VAVAYQDDPLRVVVERLAAPGVRRLVVVDAGTRRVQGVVSLSDVAAYLFL